MNIILPSLAERLQPLRKKKGKTQVEMAQFLDCTSRHYQKVEYGSVNISTLMLLKLADYFGVTTDYLLGRENEHDHKG